MDKVGICNLALGWLGANLITSIDDNTTEAKLCKAQFAHVRDYMLTGREWTFAIQRFGPLAPDVAAPTHYYTKKFQIPSTVLRLLRVEDAYAQPIEEWKREGSFVLAFDDTVYVVALVRIEDETALPETFAHALAAQLAADMAIPLTQSSSLWERRVQLAGFELQNAATLDGMQGRPVQITGPGLSRVR